MDAFAFQGEMVLQAFCDAHVPEVSYLLYAASELFQTSTRVPLVNSKSNATEAEQAQFVRVSKAAGPS